MSDTLLVRPMSGHAGAEIDNVDLSKPLCVEQKNGIRDALARHGVVFFRKQSITPAQHDRFARLFGEPTDVKMVDTVPDFPHMSLVAKAEEQLDNIGGGWHADQTFHDVPPWGTVLVARELPAFGGDTLFSSMGAAYEALSEGLKKMLDGLRAVHDNSMIGKLLASKTGKPHIPRTAVHPVVVRNPLTGRKSLFVNRAYTTHFEGWSERDSEALLSYLFIHGQRPEFQCRFRWEPGSIAFWDNIQVWHYAANDYHGQRRVMHRIAIKGTPLIAA
ncbi:TauD/TfdA dioxygenase family protein [Peristeroidobacter soli]|uniref:TauD/TfdA dioxygenase family protein n=1 Tax=Peristeroidobacter soli TaxID=2497877 RepID=UPI00101BC985|nr:TauD/TfdA family dioxygenase [Peristeroidobacter soli]